MFSSEGNSSLISVLSVRWSMWCCEVSCLFHLGLLELGVISNLSRVWFLKRIRADLGSERREGAREG